MYGTLILLLESETLIHTVQAVELGNGAAVWRALCDRYEPQTMRAQTLITSILNVPNFPEKLVEFE